MNSTHFGVNICVEQPGLCKAPPLFLNAEVMDQDNNIVVSEQSSHHALRRRCMSALAVSSTQASVVLESTPVLLEVLSSAHTGNVSGEGASTWSDS